MFAPHPGARNFSLSIPLPTRTVSALNERIMSATLASVWAETVRCAPGAVALIEGASGRAWTRGELAAEAAAWHAAHAATLARELVRTRVVFAEPNGLGWWRVFLGLQQAGAVTVALDPTEPDAAQAALAEAIGAAWRWREGKLERVGAALPGASSRTRIRTRRERSPETCLLKLTSGSTGTPKPIAFTHAQMLADGRQVCATMGIAADDLNLAVIPLGHSYGLGNLVLPLLQQGTALVCAASPLPNVLASDAARWKPTVFPAVPTLLRALVRADVEPAQFASVRRVISAGAILAAELAGEFAAKFGTRVHGFYGTSETGGIAYDRDGVATLAGRSVGRAMEGVSIAFRSRRGRFLVRSAAVRGAGSFSPPDRAELNADGELVLLGRAGRLVKIAGRRLDLGEVETALKSLRGVREAFVVAHPSRPDALAAAVVGTREPRELRAELGAKLAPWKIPARLLVLPEFPTTARGKVDTRKLTQSLRD